MNLMEFFSSRFGTKLEGELKFGDEVVDKYNRRAVVLRPPYPIGADHEMFIKELDAIFYGLREENKE